MAESNAQLIRVLVWRVTPSVLFLLALYFFLTAKSIRNIEEKYGCAPCVNSGGQKTYCNVYDWKQPIVGTFHCVDLKSTPSTPICVHDVKKDLYVSGAIVSSGMHAGGHVNLIQKLLRSDPSMGFIDLGCNIGVFSLIIAKMGRKVVCVEPLRDNVLRIHRSAQMGNLTGNIVVVQNAVSDIHGRAVLRLSDDNQGNTQVRLNTNGDNAGSSKSSPSPGTDVITMDDLLEVTNFKKAVMKMDIQGFEHRAIVGATRLLDTVYIPYITMEWELMIVYFLDPPLQPKVPPGYIASRGISLSNMTANELIIEKGYVYQAIGVLTSRGYKPYTMSGGPLKIADCYKWPTDVLWKHKDA